MKYFEDGAKILIVVGCVIALVSIYLFLHHRTENLTTEAEINTDLFDHFGSFFSGVVGTVWSLSSILLFYITLKEQRTTTQTDRIHNTFFQLMGTYTQAVSSLTTKEVTTSGSVKNETFFSGRQVYVEYYKILRKRHLQTENENSSLTSIYNALYNSSPSDLSSTLKVVLYILEFIDKARIENELKREYANILFLQISRHEHILYYYTLEIIPEFKTYRELTKKYDFFNKIDKNLVL